MSLLDVSIPDFVNSTNPRNELVNLNQYYNRMYNNYYIRLLQQFDEFNDRLRFLEQIKHIDSRESHVFIYARKDLKLQSVVLSRLIQLYNNDMPKVNSYLRNKIIQVKYENIQLRSLIERQRSRINELQELEPLLGNDNYC